MLVAWSWVASAGRVETGAEPRSFLGVRKNGPPGRCPWSFCWSRMLLVPSRGAEVLQGETMIRVLLVDDNTQYARVFAFALDLQPDIEVVGIAGTLAEARAMLEGVDVAILDRQLPDGDGLELISELREASPGAKVLVMSATPQLVNTQEVLEAGADRMLDKIAPHDKVFATIRELGARF